jgi:cytochrome b561
MTGPHQHFTALQRLLHWLMAVCILAMFFIGVGMVSTVMPKYLPLVAIHKSLGIAILVLVLIRLAVRLWSGAPALPADLPEPMKLAAYLSHYALYALMIAMPLLGWAMLSAAAYPVVVFGNTVLPPILPQSDSLHTLLWGAHFYLAFAFFALVLMHVAAALFHALIRRDGVFDAMAPWPSHREAAALLAFDRGNADAVRAAAAPSKSLEKTT